MQPTPASCDGVDGIAFAADAPCFLCQSWMGKMPKIQIRLLLVAEGGFSGLVGKVDDLQNVFSKPRAVYPLDPSASGIQRHSFDHLRQECSGQSGVTENAPVNQSCECAMPRPHVSGRRHCLAPTIAPWTSRHQVYHNREGHPYLSASCVQLRPCPRVVGGGVLVSEFLKAKSKTHSSSSVLDKRVVMCAHVGVLWGQELLHL
jgi:hypothetical protein